MSLLAGPDVANIEMALLPNTLLLELPSGWYAWPPPSELSGAASVASAAAIEAARASSLVRPKHDPLRDDLTCVLSCVCSMMLQQWEQLRASPGRRMLQAPGFHDYVSSDAELWQAPLQRVLPPPMALPAPPPTASIDSPQSSPRWLLNTQLTSHDTSCIGWQPAPPYLSSAQASTAFGWVCKH